MGIQFFQNLSARKDKVLSSLNFEAAQQVNRFHRSFPMYEATPLRDLKELAVYLGLGSVLVKDESYRFGLNAFKVLGASYAIGSLLAESMRMHVTELDYNLLVSDELREKVGPMLFVSATDGNHGRGVAWAAKQLRQEAIIFMPKGSAQERIWRIEQEGAKVIVTDGNYDEAVRIAHHYADEHQGVLIQDTSWEGYEEIPLAIMQGYMTMAYEAYLQMDGGIPSHIFLQVGVGSFATAIMSFFSSVYGKKGPKIVLVEPEAAACVYNTMKINDGKIHPIRGEMKTIMAGLACGEPVSIGMDMIRAYGDFFVSCPDETAALGMRILSSPQGEDERILSGESGAVGIGLCYELMKNEELKVWRERLGLSSDSKVLFFSTEGVTDRENYRKIIWEGAFPRTSSGV